MRVSLFVDYATRIEQSAERVLTLTGPLGIGSIADELNIYLGSSGSETAVITDRLIEALQTIRAKALREAIAAGEATFDKPWGDIARIPRIACPWQGTSGDECAAARERSVAGTPNPIPSCPRHGDYPQPTSDVDDRPGFATCVQEGHVPGCPGNAGGDHELMYDSPAGAGGPTIEVERG